jgi:peptidoglycan/LPS O-acetylase OafA/YrhL
MLKQNPDSKRIEPLDSLRGVAALLVLVYHVKYIHKLPIDSYSEFIVAKLALGVPMFFVLSSFSIFYSLHGKDFSINSMQHYFIRRFFRIAPLYYFLLLVYFFYYGKSLISLNYLSTLFLNLTFSFGFSPKHHEGLVAAGWSIGIEFLIYFLLPVLFCLIRSVRTAIIAFTIAFLIAVILAYEFYSISYAGESYSYKHIIVMLPFFFLGIAIFWIYKSEKIMLLLSKNRYILFFLSLIGVVLIYSLYYYQLHHVNIYVSFIKFSRIYVYIAMFLFLFLILLQLTNPVFLFHNKFFNYAGKWSYSIYLVHPLVIFSSKPLYSYIYTLFGNSTVSFYISLLYTLLVVLGLSFLAYRFIEEKGVSFGKAYINKLKQKSFS